MRRAALAVLALPLVGAAPASAAKQSSTPVRITAPAAANATIAGFELDLLRAKKNARGAAVTAAALPKNVSIYAVVGKQKRSDRVKGVLVAVNRAGAVSTRSARASRRRLTVNLKHAAVPKGFRLALKLSQAPNVLGSHRSFSCSSYFRPSDLGGASQVAGPGVPAIAIGTLIQSACTAAKDRAGTPFGGLAELRSALNAPSGALPFVRSATVPNEIDGTATFNYGVRAVGVLADRKHTFTACAFAAGTCAITATPHHKRNYAVFTLSAPAAAGTPLSLALAVAPSSASPLPFQFFGFDSKNHKLGPLLTGGP